MRFVTERLEDFVAGIVTAGIGIFIIIEASHYSLGSLRSMGPGYFPTVIGSIMLILALFMIVTAQPAPERRSLEKGQWRGMLFIAAAFAAFALTIESLGLVTSVSLAVFLAALANRNTTVLAALLLAVATSLVSVLVFSVGLGLQMRAF